MNKVVYLSIILAIVPCAGIFAMESSAGEREGLQRRVQRPVFRKINLTDDNPEYRRECAAQRQIDDQIEAYEHQQRQQKVERYAAEGADSFSRNL